MNYKKSLIKESEISQIAELGAEVFFEDDFYSEFKRKGRIGKKLLKNVFEKSIETCVKYGVAWKVCVENQPKAFLLAFNYLDFKKEHKDEFNRMFGLEKKGAERVNEIYLEFEKKIDINSEYMYLLAVAVEKNFRRKGIAKALTNEFCVDFERYQIIMDVTNKKMCRLAKNLGFEIFRKNVGGCDLLIKSAKPSSVDVSVDDLYVALPKEMHFFEQKPIAETIIQDVCGQKNYPAFYKKAGEVCHADIYAVDVQTILYLQSYLQLDNFYEAIGEADGKIYFYYVGKESEGEGKTFSQIVEEKDEEEKRLVVDIYTSIPMTYTHTSFEKTLEEKGFYGGRIITALGFRTEYESGVPIFDDKDSGFKKRIKRYNLGKHKIEIQSEMSIVFNTKTQTEPVGTDYVTLVLSVDEKSKICVLHIVNNSFSGKLTHYLDSVSRNQLEIIQGEESYNLYQFLFDNYGLSKVGTAKSFITCFEEKNQIKKELLASVLFSETYYNTDEALGNIVESDLIEMISLPHGISTYDYANVIIGSNVLMQMSKSLFTCVEQRIITESTTLFYIELVLFEEASIGLADQKIKQFLSKVNDIKPNKILKEYSEQLKEFASTIDFWDVQMNYPSSKVAVDNNRKYFKIEERLNQYERNQEEFKKIYETRSDYSDRIESFSLSLIGLVLTVLSLLEIVFNSLTGLQMVAITGAIVGLLLLLKDKVLFSNKGKDKKRKK